MDDIKMVCPCLFGLEGPVGAELRAMGAQNVEPDNGRVFFSGDEKILARANIWSRYGERILILLGKFPAKSFTELFDGVKTLPFERFIGKNDAFPVKGHCLNSKLFSVPDCQSIIKKAAVERLKQKYGISWFEESGTPRQIQFLLLKDTAYIMIDTSGAGLHKRGYRSNSVEAPIKETLAAAMIYFARVRKDANFIDPFCGSGTFLVEAAMYAKNIAPGARRRFSAEQFSQIPQAVWKEERARAFDLIDRSATFSAHGYDIDGPAVTLAEENARKAGVIGDIKVEKRDICDFSESGEYGCVICNPPYGERLLDVEEARKLYEIMGKVFERKHGWSYSVISPDSEFERCFGAPADKRRKLYNGMIPCQFYMYFKL